MKNNLQWVADAFGKSSIYNDLIHLKGYPHLDNKREYSFSERARDVMTCRDLFLLSTQVHARALSLSPSPSPSLSPSPSSSSVPRCMCCPHFPPFLESPTHFALRPAPSHVPVVVSVVVSGEVSQYTYTNKHVYLHKQTRRGQSITQLICLNLNPSNSSV